MRAKENIILYWKMLNSLDHPTRVQNRRQQLEYLRLENTINQHLNQLHNEFVREQKLQEAAGRGSSNKEKEEESAPAEDKQLPEEEEKEEGAEVGGSAEEHQAPAVEEKKTEAQSPAGEEEQVGPPEENEEKTPVAEEKEEGADGEEEAPEVEEIIKDPPVVERPTLRKQLRKAIMKRLRRVWHSTQRLNCCCCRPNTMA
ncbi:cilia- and flagella-associated protein 251-like [Xenopus laevis]|uniref:Cilia- and flagella-associated protein 251-like n=1 Tax=Xenopus laevis TaxID=8355 RepID=A0A8J1LAQ0_XENLA|nr:cilia- and flagella-associated protein 251-like [Xenopus laevis]